MPERMCMICKKRNEKQNLFRFSSVDGRYLYDKKQKIQSRGFYLCDNPACLNALSKHKKVKVEADELIKILNILKKKNKDILDILKSMRGSEKSGLWNGRKYGSHEKRQSKVNSSSGRYKEKSYDRIGNSL